jgi:hypothetical protein
LHLEVKSREEWGKPYDEKITKIDAAAARRQRNKDTSW